MARATEGQVREAITKTVRHLQEEKAVKSTGMKDRKGPPKKSLPPHQHYGQMPKGKVNEAGDKSKERKRALTHMPKKSKG